MTKSRVQWADLPPAARTAIVVVGGLDLALRACALVDLARRPASEVNGPKSAWALALSLVNSAGAVPLTYLFLGRRRGV